MASGRGRVDDVPWWWRPFHLAGWWAIALPVYLFMVLQRSTCRVEIVGRQRLVARENHIFAYWHENVWSLFIFFLFSAHGQVWMQHPARYMKGVHNVLALMGVRIVLGSRGDEGQRAADEIARRVGAGASTAVAPDGPGGPVRVLKRGVLHMAAGSGVPVTPLAFDHGAAWRAPSWDRKWIALPFSRITVFVGEPVTVMPETLDEAERKILEGLSKR
jgi:lysophospholipid acyltransferase (LPLAT)-like uncharacterized protein